MNRLLCLGFGYSAKYFVRRLDHNLWHISGTTRNFEKFESLKDEDIAPLLYDGCTKSNELADEIKKATHILTSIAPGDQGDPILCHYLDELKSDNIKWIGYLSTVGVYGNWDGDWVDETSETKPVSKRSRLRVAAENAWLQAYNLYNTPIHIFRLSGIYGPGRSPLQKLMDGKSKRIIKLGQVFNRIHVEDIASTLMASINQLNPGRIYNVTDDEPAPPQDVICYGADLLKISPPPEVPFETADITPMARSFYGENKRVRNSRIKQELDVSLKYRTYREGLSALTKDFFDN